MSDSLQLLKARTGRIVRLRQIMALLDWDQQTYMPDGAAASRGEHSAALSELIHEMFASDETGGLLTRAEAELAGSDPEGDDVRLLAVLRHDYDLATKLPTELVTEMARHTAISQSIWVRARAENNFLAFAPALSKMIDLTRRQAECLGYKDHIYDPLVDSYEPGMTQAQVAAVFAEMKPGLIKLTQQIAESPRTVDDSLVHGDFPAARQKDFTLRIVGRMGFDLTRGRQDEAQHPFCTNFSRDDVRLTTRFDPTYLSQALYASLHEAGHGLYEQGVAPQYDGTELAAGTSLGIHESQSRLWENLVGRGRAFTNWIFPQLQSEFPQALGGVDAEAYYRAVNKVEPSLIRVEADEVTYNLHILMRFELECDLLTGSLRVSELPGAWAAKMKEYLGVVPTDDAHGVLQDIHWSGGLIGYFPTYSLGNLASVQFLRAATRAIPDLDSRIERGEFAPLLEWLRANIHRHGRKYLPNEIIERATGEPLTSRYYMDYLSSKYGDIYGL